MGRKDSTPGPLGVYSGSKVAEMDVGVTAVVRAGGAVPKWVVTLVAFSLGYSLFSLCSTGHSGT